MDELEKDALDPEVEGDETELDPDLLIGDDDAALDEEEVNPFGDKWEE